MEKVAEFYTIEEACSFLDRSENASKNYIIDKDIFTGKYNVLDAD